MSVPAFNTKNITQLSAANPIGATDILLLFQGTSIGSAATVQQLQTYFDGEYQPLNANLTALAGQTWAADQLTYQTGVAAVSNTPLTAYARTLLAAGSSGSIAPILGLGTMSTQDADAVAITGGTVDGLDWLGVNTTADATNRLSAYTNATLYSAVTAADGGTGDIRSILSKETTGDTASFLFQNNFSSRAEIGLVGDDNFHFKVSATGSAFIDALVIDAATGAVTAAAPVTVPAGDQAAPGINIGGTGYGWWHDVTDDMIRVSTPTVSANKRTGLDQAGRLIVGVMGVLYPVAIDGITPQFQFLGNGNAQRASLNGSWGNNSNAVVAYNLKSRAALPGSFAAVQSADTLKVDRYFGDDGASYVYGAYMAVSVAGTVATNSVPTRFAWGTMAVGATTRAERFGIEADGSLSMGATANTIATVNRVSTFQAAGGAWQSNTPTTGFSLTISDYVARLLLTPAGTLASGTLTMPSNPVDGQRISIRSTQIVTALTHNGNTGQTIVGALTTLAANTAYAFAYRGTSPTAGVWYPD